VFVVQQVSFFMNNLTVDNMPQKSKELGHVIIPKYIEWFANYLVVRRAAQVIWGTASLLHFGSWPFGSTNLAHRPPLFVLVKLLVQPQLPVAFSSPDILSHVNQYGGGLMFCVLCVR
jgi:hypothetical protein